MERRHTATSCRWAVSTLYLDSPLWLQSWNCPWSCLRDTEPRLLETTDECRTCSRWQPLEPGAKREPLRPAAAR